MGNRNALENSEQDIEASPPTRLPSARDLSQTENKSLLNQIHESLQETGITTRNKDIPPSELLNVSRKKAMKVESP